MRLSIKSQHTFDVVKYNVVKNNLMVKLTIVIYFKVSNIYYSIISVNYFNRIGIGKIKSLTN